VCNKEKCNIQYAEKRDERLDYQNLYYENNKDQKRTYGIAYRNRLKMEDPAKFRAKKFFDSHRKDVDADVTKEYLEHLFRSTTHCQCCGKTLFLGYRDRGTRKSWADPDAPSVDRANNKKGYTRPNIAIACCHCNQRKADLTLEHLEMFAQYIKKFGDFNDVL
jgi:hypothetical protein